MAPLEASEKGGDSDGQVAGDDGRQPDQQARPQRAHRPQSQPRAPAQGDRGEPGHHEHGQPSAGRRKPTQRAGKPGEREEAGAGQAEGAHRQPQGQDPGRVDEDRSEQDVFVEHERPVERPHEAGDQGHRLAAEPARHPPQENDAQKPQHRLREEHDTHVAPESPRARR
jgi:hypothetical protein